MINDALKCLFIPIDFTPKSKILFLNAAPHIKTDADFDYIQPYYNLAKQLPETITAPNTNHYDYALISGTKNHTETRYYIAQALSALKPNGTIICAAPNDAGGKRLKKDLDTLGLNTDEISKHKCRTVWAVKSKNCNKDIVQDWLTQGSEQQIPAGNFKTQPGIFGWNKSDTGSKLLTQSLPQNITGNGTDFGCGYGYLSNHLLQNNPGIQKINAIDYDRRAVNLCAKNLANLKHQAQINTIWDDLTDPDTILKNLDWIIMNPPFHDGKNKNTSMGHKFIETAAKFLKPGGHLWMVANTQLPYEQTLDQYFSIHNEINKKDGFKIIHAAK